MREKLANVTIRAVLIAVLAGGASTAVWPEEGGAGHYAPGANASFVDGLIGKPGWALANFFMYYDASAAGSARVPSAGLLTFGLKSRAYANTVVALWETPVKLGSGDYTVGLGIPYVSVDVDAEVSGELGNRLAAHDSASGIGDILLYPFMVCWPKGDLKYDVRLGVYAPTGEYHSRRLANVGKNYWTLEPTASVIWMSSKRGTEVSAFTGFDFNTTNDEIDYKSGDVFHLDVTAAQHFPLGKVGILGVGANAFYYQQISGDSGNGALLGDFKGKTVGIGPTVSLITRAGKTNLAFELKWLPELSVERRVKGDFVWFKLGVVF